MPPYVLLLTHDGVAAFLQYGSAPAPAPAPDHAAEPSAGDTTQIWGTNIFVSDAMGKVRKFMSDYENEDGDKLYPSLLEEVGTGAKRWLLLFWSSAR